MGNEKTCKDHLGNEYPTIADMLKAYNRSYSSYQKAIKDGLSIEEALNPRKCKGNSRICKDHIGNCHSSIKDMCKYYGITKSAYDRRLKNGWSLEKTLTTPLTDNTVTDYLGNTYSSITKMCEAYNLSPTAYLRNIERGMTPKEALLSHYKYSVSYKGKSYNSLRELCAKLSLNKTEYKRINHRVKSGLSIEDAIALPKRYSFGECKVISVLDSLKNEYGISYVHDKRIKDIVNMLGLSSYYNDIKAELVKTYGIKDCKMIDRFRFDFTLTKNGRISSFIEYDGKQHFGYVHMFFKTIEEFIYRCDVDTTKTGLAEISNIPLLRIRYDQDDVIEELVRDLLERPEWYIENHNKFLSNEEYYKPLYNDEKYIASLQIA